MGDETGKPVSCPYLRNMVGMDVDEESMKCVPHAQGELYFHVATKCAQAGSILGGLIGGGLGAVRSHLTASKGFINGSRNGMLIGLPIGVVATYMRMDGLKKADADCDLEYAYFDRSYRLRHNRNQVRVDRSAYVGVGVGTAVAMASGAGILGGAAVGLTAGTVTGGLYNAIVAKQP